jgi:hypothetical protein
VPEDYKESALRHFIDADRLASSGAFDGAGHLIGFSAECALKYCVENLRPNAEIPHVHFPQIIEAAKRQLQSRRQSSMLQALKRPELMADWKIESRYSGNDHVTPEIYYKWREDASSLIHASGLKR